MPDEIIIHFYDGFGKQRCGMLVAESKKGYTIKNWYGKEDFVERNLVIKIETKVKPLTRRRK